MAGVERIIAGSGDDIIDMTSPEFIIGNMELQGNEGSDILWGNDGNDILDGGLDQDFLAGGLGSDLFILRKGEEASTYENADHIRDFDLINDKFALSNGLTFEDLKFEIISDGKPLLSYHRGFKLITKSSIRFFTNLLYLFSLNG